MPGGYLLYDSSKPLPAAKFDDITVIGAPSRSSLRGNSPIARTPAFSKNICYVGVLASIPRV